MNPFSQKKKFIQSTLPFLETQIPCFGPQLRDRLEFLENITYVGPFASQLYIFRNTKFVHQVQNPVMVQLMVFITRVPSN